MAGADVAAGRVVSRPATSRRKPNPTSASTTTAQPPRRRPRALTAASRRIDITTREGISLVRKPEGWQSEAWAFYRSVPPITFGANYKGSALSRVRLYPGVVLNPDEPPVSLWDAAESKDEEAADITLDLAEAAEAEFARLDNSRGGVPGLLDSAAVCLTLAGEFYLLGWPETEDEEERWGVFSSSAVQVKGKSVSVREHAGSARGKPLPGDAFVARIWVPDAEWPGDAWSNMRAGLGAAEEYVIWSRVFRAVAKSGANGGILTMPTQLDLEAMQRAATDTGEDGAQPDLTELQESYVDYVTEAIERDDTAAAAAAWVLDGDYDYLDKVRWIDTTRRIDDKVLERLDELKEDHARAVDLPPEVIKGLADSASHWNAWLVDDQTWKAHLEPPTQVIAQGWCKSFLRPGLVENWKIDRELAKRVVLGVDPSGLVARPNRSADAEKLHTAMAISDAAYRSALSFSDADAPDEEELWRRYALQRSNGSPQITAEAINRSGLLEDEDQIAIPAATAPGGGQGAPAEGEAPPGEDGGDAVPDSLPAARALPDASAPPAAAPVLALAAATEPGQDDDESDPWWLLALFLARIEASLLARLTVAASDDATEALRKAGNRLRTKAQGNPTTRDRVTGADPEDVPGLLGPELVAAMADMAWLLDGSTDRLHQRWDSWIGAAQEQVAGQMERLSDLAPDPAGAKAAAAEYRRNAAAARDAGWDVADQQVRHLLADRVMSNVIDIVEGEGDPTQMVPAGLLRDALARAGGGEPGLGPSGAAKHSGPGGLTTGPWVRALLDALGAQTMAWRWDHGLPATPFEPHARLDGVEFDRWDDERLVSSSPWPSVSHYYPGDHRGCTCTATPVITGPVRTDRNGGT